MKITKKQLRKIINEAYSRNNLINEAELEDLRATFFHRGKQYYQLCLEREKSGWEMAGLFQSINEAKRMGKRMMSKNVAYPTLEEENRVVNYKIKDLSDQIVYEAE